MTVALPAASAQSANEWVVLFDGETTAGWRGFNQEIITTNWTAVDGELRADGTKGDIVTEAQFADFELNLEWKISEGGNSGIFFHVKEHPDFTEIWRTGIEMQVMDNEKNPLGGDLLTNAGSMYAMYPASEDATKQAGEWNQVRMLVDGAHVEYWLNGTKVNAYTMWTEQWYADREECLVDLASGEWIRTRREKRNIRE